MTELFNKREDGLVAAEDIVMMGQKIAAFGQLYIFLKASQHGTRAQHGVVCQLQMYDQQQTLVVVNSNLLYETLMKEFREIGNMLESKQVDVQALLTGIEAQFQQRYPNLPE